MRLDSNTVQCSCAWLVMYEGTDSTCTAPAQVAGSPLQLGRAAVSEVCAS